VEARLAVVVLSNSAARIEDIGFHVLDQRAELTEERQAIDLPAEVLKRYVGLYQLDPEGAVTVTQTEGGLVAEATGLGVAPIYPATETEFFVKVLPLELTFQFGPRGVATGVVVRFAGRQMRGRQGRVADPALVHASREQGGADDGVHQGPGGATSTTRRRARVCRSF
jgi:hypothetical protein